MSHEEQDFTDAQALRTKAEEKLKKKQDKIFTSPLESDVKRLVHELQVHQIELEMQNEELLHANERVEAALKKYTMMYDFAPMGYLTLNQDGMIQELNFTAAEMLGERRFSLINSSFRLFLSSESLPIFNSFLNAIYSNNLNESCQVTFSSESNKICPIYIEGVQTGEDNKCFISVVDISNLIYEKNKI